jgi:hypothetical protein
MWQPIPLSLREPRVSDVSVAVREAQDWAHVCGRGECDELAVHLQCALADSPDETSESRKSSRVHSTG